MTEDAPFVGRLIKALRDKDQGVRQDAVHPLGVIGDARAVEPLIDALGDEAAVLDSEFCLNVVCALGEIGDTRAVDPLIELLENGSRAEFGSFQFPGYGVLAATVRALKKLGHEVE